MHTPKVNDVPMHFCAKVQTEQLANTMWLSPQHLDEKWATIYPEWPHAHHQHYRLHALRIRRSGCAWFRPRAGLRATQANAVVICMREYPELAQPAVCGLRRPARSQVHAHVHFACAVRVAIAHVHVASELTLPFFSLPLHRGM